MAAPRRNFPIGASDALSHSRYFVGKPNIALTLRRVIEAVLYLMCDDLRSVIARLKNKGVVCSSPVDAEWGTSTSLRLPSGGEIGLYQPTHPTMIEMHST